MDKNELMLRKKLMNSSSSKEIEKIAQEYCTEHKINDIDDFEMKLKLLKSNTESALELMSKEYKLPVEIIKEVYEFSLNYPTLKDFCMDEKARKIYTKEYKKDEEIGSIEIIRVTDDDKGKENIISN